MTPFRKPGSDVIDYPQMVREAGQAALQDAGIGYGRIEQAVVGHVYGDSTSAQRGLYELGLTGIPITGVTNNCSTGRGKVSPRTTRAATQRPSGTRGHGRRSPTVTPSVGGP